MATFDEIRDALRDERYRISEHGGDEMLEEEVSIDDVVSVTLAEEAEVIEDYPNAFPYPACLVLTKLENGEPFHLVWAFEPPSGYAVVVTVYRPDPALWSADFRERVE